MCILSMGGSNVIQENISSYRKDGSIVRATYICQRIWFNFLQLHYALIESYNCFHNRCRQEIR